MVLRRVFIFPILVMVVAVVGACGGGGGMVSAPSSQVRVGPPEVAFVWDGAGLLDMDSSEGTFVRAVVESMDMWQTVGRRFGYPGFERASRHEPKMDFFPRAADRGVQWVGEIPLRIVRVVRPDPRTVRVQWCGVLGREGQRKRGSQGPFKGVKMSTEGVLVVTKSGAQPPSGQRGVGHRPVGDVFGGWTFRWIQDDTPEELANVSSCNLPERDRGVTTFAVPPPVPASSPGWPTGGRV